MLQGRRIRHKGLRLLYEKDEARRINPNWLSKLKRILAALNTITAPEELDLPGYGFHKLQGDRSGTYSLSVTRNWRVTFEWDLDGPHNVDLEDYHGH